MDLARILLAYPQTPKLQKGRVLVITELHGERLETVCSALVESCARTVLDLGCGSGALLQRLICEPQFEKIVGVDKCGRSLWRARHLLRDHLDDDSERLSLVVGSYAEHDAGLRGFDACAMVETIEHVRPGMLAGVEEAVFGFYRPKTVIITTPNAEFNPILGLQPNQLREPDHHFEWGRARFRAWAEGVAARNGYGVHFSGVGEVNETAGQPTQMAQFRHRAIGEC